MAANRGTGLQGNLWKAVMSAVGVVAALTLPALAVAHEAGRGRGHEQSKLNQGNGHRHAHGPNPVVSYIFKGVVAVVNADEKTVLVSVNHMNHHRRRFAGHDTSFDLSN